MEEFLLCLTSDQIEFIFGYESLKSKISMKLAGFLMKKNLGVLLYMIFNNLCSLPHYLNNITFYLLHNSIDINYIQFVSLF